MTVSPKFSPIRIESLPATSIELDGYLNAYLSKKCCLPPRSVKSQLMPHIAALRVEAAEHRDYKTAARLSQAEQELRSYFQSEMHHDRAVRVVQTPATTASGLSERLQAAIDKFDQDIAEYTQSRNEFMEELRLAHEFEMKEFHERWADPECLKAYTKASPHLLQLREIERRKVLLMDYDGAEETRKAADRVESEETAIANAKIQQGMAMQLAQIKKRHQMEIDAAERLTEKKLCHLRTQKSSIVVPLQKQLAKAERREEMEPVVIRALSNRGRQVRAPRYEGDDVDLASSRTYSKVLRMRMSSAARRLQVDGGDGESRAPTSRRSPSAQRNRI
jgi:hypothetical protein